MPNSHHVKLPRVLFFALGNHCRLTSHYCRLETWTETETGRVAPSILRHLLVNFCCVAVSHPPVQSPGTATIVKSDFPEHRHGVSRNCGSTRPRWFDCANASESSRPDHHFHDSGSSRCRSLDDLSETAKGSSKRPNSALFM